MSVANAGIICILQIIPKCVILMIVSAGSLRELSRSSAITRWYLPRPSTGKQIARTGTTPIIFGYNGRDGVVTGVDLYNQTVSTNNPWGISGEQSFEEFQNGVLGSTEATDMPFYNVSLISEED